LPWQADDWRTQALADKPVLVLSFDPPGPEFPISTQSEMPNITVTAKFQNITPDPKVPLQFSWTVDLSFNGTFRKRQVPHALGRVIQHPPIAQVTATNQFKIPFAAVRGGDLTVKVAVTVCGTPLSATSEGLAVIGSNPSTSELALVAAPIVAFRKLMWVESRFMQFLGGRQFSGMPYFSEDDLGGAGICQVTDPSPTDEQVWKWKDNIAAGWQIYKGKEAIARHFPANFRAGKTFAAMVTTYNDERYRQAVEAGAKAKPPVEAKNVPRKDLTITIPDLTEEQVQLETIRLYNGAPLHIHEYRPKMDTVKTPKGEGLLLVTVDEASLKGTAEWERVPVEDRKQQYRDAKLPEKNWGDPNYVDDVMSSPGF
jgi:hypothetical protein